MLNRRGKLCPPSTRGNRTTGRSATARLDARLAALLLLAPLGGCALRARETPTTGAPEVHEYLERADRAPFAGEVVDTAPAVLWHARVGRGTLGLPAMGERVTVVATVDRWIYAIGTRTGRPYWRHRGDAPFGPGPLVSGGRVYAATEGPLGRVIAVDLRTGRRRWQARVGDVSAPLVLRGDTLYGVTTTGAGFAYRAADGRPVWTREVGRSRAAPVVLGDRIAFVTLTDTLVTLARGTGAEVGRATLPTSATAAPARLDDSTLVIADPAGALLAVSVPGGTVRWRVPLDGPVAGAPVVARDTVWALTTGCTLWRVPLAAPARADSASVGCVTEAAPAVVRGGVLVATVKGEVIYYDSEARRRVWTRQIKGPLRQPPLVRNGQILVAPVVGEVVSFR